MNGLDVQPRVSVKNVLYATDFSPVAEFAAPIAAELARKFGAKVLAVHVRPPQVYGLAPPESWPAIQEASDRQTEEQKKHLEGLFRGVKNSVLIGEGDTVEVISALIKDKEIDLVVIGTHGRRNFEKVLLGSVAEKILRRSPVPVLTVGPHVTSEPEQAAWIQHILYATDFSPASEGAAHFAISLAEENQAHLDLLHVIEPRKAKDYDSASEFVHARTAQLESLVPTEAQLWCQPKYLVEVGNPAEEILKVAKRYKADLIVMGVKRTEHDLGASNHLPWAIAHKVISQARCPVLTVVG
jgi:nucleotide-binding universal stress UspA family protein